MHNFILPNLDLFVDRFHFHSLTKAPTSWIYHLSRLPANVNILKNHLKCLILNILGTYYTKVKC